MASHARRTRREQARLEQERLQKAAAREKERQRLLAQAGYEFDFACQYIRRGIRSLEEAEKLRQDA